ncbi:MAG: calcium/sodium antiporter [Candidatus Poseidoniales archaeon]|jgi:cation:H+ antiporter
MGEEEPLGIGALLHWNSLLVLGSIFVTLVGLTTFTSRLDGVHISIVIGLLILSITLLITAADFFIEGAKGLAQKAGIAEVIIGLTIVSIGTSLPEILVTSTAAASAGRTGDTAMMDLAVGNIFGSVLVQITFILGIVALVTPLNIRPDWLRRDGLIMLGAVLLCSLLLWTGGGLSRLEGLILCSTYVAYIWWLLRNRENIREDEIETVGEIRSSDFSWTTAAYLVMVIIGLFFAIFAATKLVELASEIGKSMNIPPAIVGTVMSGLGTSLPELTVALMAAKRSSGVAIGTLVGSNITDPLLSIGIAAMINPLEVSTESYALIMHLIVPATIIGVCICLFMMYTGMQFTRMEGGVLIGLYIFFLVLLELQRKGFIVL